MMLNNKVAVIYGAGGAIGSAVARAFAREGAKNINLKTQTEGVQDENRNREEPNE